MDKAERTRRHLAALDRIQQVQCVVGRGDRARIDHEATLFERARLTDEEVNAHRATEAAIVAMHRLLGVLESGDPGPKREVAGFLSAVWNRRPLDLASLRGTGPSVGDDMLAVLDGFRHARLDLVEQVPGGALRMQQALARASAATP